MSKPDLVSEVLTYLTDGSGANENWDTGNYSPAPILYNARDGVRQDTGDRVKNVDLTENAVITVNASPATRNTPMGAEYDNKFEAGVGVIIEAVHEDIGGNIADDDDFDSLVTEAVRAINAERKSEITASGDHATVGLFIREEHDLSHDPERAETRTQRLHYFEYRFDVFADGFETLP